MTPYSFIKRIKSYESEGRKLVMSTCYDATFARILDKSDVDLLLVGDSLGMVVKGEKNTLSVTMEEMLYHTRAVARGSESKHIVADMPFLSYQCDDIEAIRNAGKLLQAGAHSVKLEGGSEIAPLIRRMVQSGIPIMGHIGLTPQSISTLGGFVVQGKSKDAHHRLIEDAEALQSAGAFSIVLEGMQSPVAAHITDFLNIPTIGIGAGSQCSGQVLVIYDLLGLDAKFKPKFVRNFMDGSTDIQNALKNYSDAVKQGHFPNGSEQYQ